MPGFIKFSLFAALLVLAGCFSAAKLVPCECPCGDEGWSSFPHCVRQVYGTGGQVEPAVLSQLTFDPETNLAYLRLADGWAYVNRDGAVILTGVVSFDNGPDPFNDGLARFVRDGRYGFADPTGKTVIPPVYDGALYFSKGHARVCHGCSLVRAGEHTELAGGRWECIDTAGNSVDEKVCEP